MAASTSAKYYAILVGVGYCKGKTVKGAVNDVQEMADRLSRSRQNIEIHTLKSSSNDPNASVPSEDRLDLPTFQNIVAQFQNIVSKAQSGDFFYFHFSGHGTTIEPRITRSIHTTNLDAITSSGDYVQNKATDHLALQLVSEEDSSDERYLRGRELASLLKSVVDKGLKITVVLDCCFSGEVVRRRSEVRFAPYNPNADARYPLDLEIAPCDQEQAEPPEYRIASVAAWLVNPKGYSIFAACGPNETAKEVCCEKDGKHYGALTYYLLGVFDRLGRVGGRQHHIYTYLCARFRERRSDQNPMLYGNKSLGFFEASDPNLYATPIPALQRERTLQLEAGEAHGVCVEDRFAATDSSHYAGNIGARNGGEIFEVTNLGPFSSELKALNETSTRTTSGMTAIACTNLKLRKFPIHIYLRGQKEDSWTRVLEKKPSLEVTIGNSEPKTTFAIFVAIIDNDHYEIRDKSKKLLKHLPPITPSSEANILFIIDILEHLARFQMIRSLANTSSPHDFMNSFEVQIMDEKFTTAFKPGCHHGVSLCLHPECVVEVKHMDRIYLIVENKTAPTGSNLYIHAYNMSSLWEVENMMKGDYDVVEATKTWRRRITMEVPASLRDRGESECEDIVKIFITTHPVSFLSLELPEICTIGSSEKRSPQRGTNGSQQRPEHWATFNFRVRTSLTCTR